MPAETHLPKSKPPQLLIVDDEELDRFIFRRSILLPGIDCDIKEIADPIEALSLLQDDDTYTPELIVTDIHMPEMDGYDFIAGVRKIPRLANTPILVITSFSPDNDQEKALAAGAIGFFIKPITDLHIREIATRLFRDHTTLMGIVTSQLSQA